MEDNNQNKIDSTYNPIRLEDIMNSPVIWDDLPSLKLDVGEPITMKWARQWILRVLNQFGMDYVVEEPTVEGTFRLEKFRVTNFLPGSDNSYGFILQSLANNSALLDGIIVYHRYGSSILYSAFKDSNHEIGEEDKKDLEAVYTESCALYISDWVKKFTSDGENTDDKEGEIRLWLKVVLVLKSFLQVIYSDLQTIALRDCQDQLLYATKSISFNPADFKNLGQALENNRDYIVESANDVLTTVESARAKLKEELQKEESEEDNSENASEQA